jgi:maltose/moltooligosaccharide transporter
MSTVTEKPKLSFWQIWNMSFGFMGIQFGWGLQMANMSSIYESLGAQPDQIPGLWLAAPLTGLLVQPIIGYLSDRTWHPVLGRRRPYFLIGAILSSICLFVMPNCGTLWMAAGLLWILDSSINISMEPFRAFVTDKLPKQQRTFGFSMQSMFIGLGATIASALPWIFTNLFNVENIAIAGSIADNVKWSFYLGGFAFLACVCYTNFTTKEYPPDPIDLEKKEAITNAPSSNIVSEIWYCIKHMPTTMKQLAIVQFLTWPGLFLMWFYYTPAVAVDIFGGQVGDQAYANGQSFAGLTYSFENIVTFLFALLLPLLANKLGKKYTHFTCLVIGGLALMSTQLIHDEAQKYWLFCVMAGVGIAWSSILSMPYSLLSDCLPSNKVGVYMGIFNFFIVLPEIIASIGFGWVMNNLLHNNRLTAVFLGGCLMIIAAFFALRIKENQQPNSP